MGLFPFFLLLLLLVKCLSVDSQHLFDCALCVCAGVRVGKGAVYVVCLVMLVDRVDQTNFP